MPQRQNMMTVRMRKLTVVVNYNDCALVVTGNCEYAYICVGTAVIVCRNVQASDSSTIHLVKSLIYDGFRKREHDGLKTLWFICVYNEQLCVSCCKVVICGAVVMYRCCGLLLVLESYVWFSTCYVRVQIIAMCVRSNRFIRGLRKICCRELNVTE